MKKIAIIGSGFSGLSSAAYLSKAGYEVHVFEKNSTIEGRARNLKTESGYSFDMGLVGTGCLIYLMFFLAI